MVSNAYTPWDSILHNTGLVPQSNIGPTLLTHILITPKGFPKNAPLLDAVVYPEQALMVVKNPRLDASGSNPPVKDRLPMSEILWQAYKSGTGHSNSRPQIRKLLSLQIPQGTTTHHVTRNLRLHSNRGSTIDDWVTPGPDNPPPGPWEYISGSDLVQPVMRMLCEHGAELDYPDVPPFAIVRGAVNRAT